MLKVKAGKLAEALKPAKAHALKKRPKPTPVSIEHDIVSGTLMVIEARHGAFSNSVSATGDWQGPVQVDGNMLYQVTAKWPADVDLELGFDAGALTIASGKSLSRIARVDGGGAQLIERKPPPPDKRHKGKVEVASDPLFKRVELADTWAFSARVPMPQHRDPEDKS